MAPASQRKTFEKGYLLADETPGGCIKYVSKDGPKNQRGEYRKNYLKKGDKKLICGSLGKT